MQLFSDPEREHRPFKGLISTEIPAYESDFRIEPGDFAPIWKNRSNNTVDPKLCKKLQEWWRSKEVTVSLSRFLSKSWADPYGLIPVRGRKWGENNDPNRNGQKALLVVESGLHCVLLLYHWTRLKMSDRWNRVLPATDQRFVRSVEKMMLERGSKADILAAGIEFVSRLELGGESLPKRLLDGLPLTTTLPPQFSRSVRRRIQHLRKTLGPTGEVTDFESNEDMFRKRFKLRRYCQCGCGYIPKQGRFMPGHDAKLESRERKKKRIET